MDLNDSSFLQLLRKIIREELDVGLEGVKTDIKEMKTDIREVKVDIRDMKTDIRTIKSVQSSHSVAIKALQTDVASLKTANRQHGKELHKLGILYEDLDYRFMAASEAT